MSVDDAITALLRGAIREELAAAGSADQWLDVVADIDTLVGRRERRRAELAGELRTVRRGRRVLARQSWLDDYLAAGRPANPAPANDDDDVAGILAAEGWRDT